METFLATFYGEISIFNWLKQKFIAWLWNFISQLLLMWDRQDFNVKFALLTVFNLKIQLSLMYTGKIAVLRKYLFENCRRDFRLSIVSQNHF